MGPSLILDTGLMRCGPFWIWWLFLFLISTR